MSEKEKDDEVHIYDAASVALSAADRAQIDMQVATAKQYPRSIDKAMKEAESLVTMDEDTATSMMYSLPRGNNPDGSKKFIEGPSVRLAEIIAFTWGNLRIQSGVVSEDTKSLTAQATCFDIERNIAIRVDVKRSIWGRSGRYNEDMIGMTGNAGISVALRNSVFKVVPRVFVDRIYAKARAAALGDLATFSVRRNKLVEKFTKASISGAPITDKEVFALLGVRGLDDILQEQYLQLIGVFNAISTGDTTLKKVFRPEGGGAASVNDALKKAAAVEGAPAVATDPAPAAAEAPTETAPAAAPVDEVESEAERDARLADDARIAAADKAQEKKGPKRV